MDTIEAIRSRRAVKKFDPDHKLSDEEIKEIISLAALSPSAFNIQHWRFVVVKDKNQREKIKEAAWGQSQVTDASILVILCADIKAWQKDTERYWDFTPENVRKSIADSIHNYYKGNDSVQRDEGIRSCGIAAQTLMLAARSLGLDSCPMDGFDFDKVGKLIDLPEDHIIVMFVAIGKSLAEARPRGGKLPLDEIMISDKFK
ncbi:nitroreductase family protein [candidate division KSB1 bacterium]